MRAGYEMKVFTKTEVWTPSIEFVEKFDDKVLVVRTAARKTAGLGVEVRIKMPIADWMAARKLFRFLVDDDPEFLVDVEAGTILLHPDRQGQVYVKGIYITTVSTLGYGYDLKHVRLDRDRRMVDSWDLRWELSKVLRDGVAKDPEKLGPAVYSMLKRKTEDVGSLEYNSSEAFAATMAEHFQTEHGEAAIPVVTMAESQSLDHLGAKGVVVSDTLRKVLEKKVKSAAEVRRELTRTVVAEFSWHDLEAEEQATLTKAIQLIHDATADIRAACHLPPLLDRLTVAVFKDVTLRGMCDGAGSVKIARRELIDLQGTLRVLVHEEAHAVSFSSDGSKGHVDAIQDIWAALYFGRS